MAQMSSIPIDESDLTKGQIRKLNALRKSVGNEIADRAFSEWFSSRPATEKTDKDAVLISDTLMVLVEEGKLKIPRGGYLVRRGHGRVVVDPAKA